MKKIFLTLCLSCLLISTMFVSTYATTMNVADNYLETDNYILKRENSSEKTIVYVKGKDGAILLHYNLQLYAILPHLFL